MTTDLLLAHHLKQLRLLTIAKQYASLAREAVEHGLSYEAYLLALVEQGSERGQVMVSFQQSITHDPSALMIPDNVWIPRFAKQGQILLRDHPAITDKDTLIDRKVPFQPLQNLRHRLLV